MMEMNKFDCTFTILHEKTFFEQFQNYPVMLCMMCWIWFLQFMTQNDQVLGLWMFWSSKFSCYVEEIQREWWSFIIWATFTIIFWGTSWLTTIFWKLEGFKTADNYASTANYRLSSFRPLNSINWIQINYCFQKANIRSELRKHETLESLSNTMALLTFVNKFRTLNREWE